MHVLEKAAGSNSRIAGSAESRLKVSEIFGLFWKLNVEPLIVWTEKRSTKEAASPYNLLH